MQMYTGTRLTTAIHRRLLSRFFLKEGGRLYTGYQIRTVYGQIKPVIKNTAKTKDGGKNSEK